MLIVNITREKLRTRGGRAVDARWLVDVASTTAPIGGTQMAGTPHDPARLVRAYPTRATVVAVERDSLQP
jgi:hypothetical protein